MIKHMKKNLNLGDVILLHIESLEKSNNPISNTGQIIGYLKSIKEDGLVLDAYDPEGHKPACYSGHEFFVPYTEIKNYERVI